MNDKWKIYIVTHDSLYKQMYFHDAYFGEKNYEVLNVGEGNVKDSLNLPVVNQRELSNYQQQGKWWAESEGIYNLWKSKRWKKMDHIGFIHYDLELRLDDRVSGFPRTNITGRINDYLRDRARAHISFETHDFETDYNQHIMADYRFPNSLTGDGKNCYDYILDVYNHFYGTNITVDDLRKLKQINLCSCFLIDTTSFNEMMLFWDYVVQKGDLERFDPNHLYRLQGGLAERFFGVWLMLHYSEMLDVSLVHHYNDGLKKGIKQHIIIKRRDEKIGLASFFNTTLGAVDYLTRKGFQPVVCDENRFGWDKWFGSNLRDMDIETTSVFEKVVPYRPDDDMEILCNEELIKYWHESWENLIGFNAVTQETLDRITHDILNNTAEKTIGVLARGTDYVALEPNGHPRQPNAEELFDRIDMYLDREYENVFLATEDSHLLTTFKEKYGEKLLYRVESINKYKGNGFLNDSIEEDEKQRIDRNFNYLINLYVLSKCGAFVGGRTSGTVMTFVLSGGFRDYYLWNRGRYGDEKLMQLEKGLLDDQNVTEGKNRRGLKEFLRGVLR